MDLHLKCDTERGGKKKSLLVDLTTVTCACSLGNKVNIEQESQCCHQKRGDGWREEGMNTRYKSGEAAADAVLKHFFFVRLF